MCAVAVVRPTATEQPTATQTPSAVPGTAPLIVGDNRSVDLISLGGPGTDALLARVRTDIGGAVGAVERFWGTDWSHDLVVIAAGTAAQFQDAAGGAAQGADIAAIAVADRVDAADRVVEGQRVVLAPGAAAMGPEALQLVLTHELFHYAARADTALDAPRWIAEGVADFVARPAAGRPAPAAVPPALPSDADLDAVGPRRALAYDQAWWFIRFVADSYGAVAVRRLYLAACGSGHPDVATAVRDVLGVELPDLMARWRHWLAFST